MLNEIHNNVKIDNKVGIKYINLNIHNLILNNNIPLEVIFKIFNSSNVIPYIKYNPGKKLENIFRLYSDKYGINGIKIPF